MSCRRITVKLVNSLATVVMMKRLLTSFCNRNGVNCTRVIARFGAELSVRSNIPFDWRWRPVASSRVWADRRIAALCRIVKSTA